MTTPDDLLQILDLQREAVERQAEFLIRYSTAAERFREIDPDRYEGSDGSDVGLIPFKDDDGSPEDGDDPDFRDEAVWVEPQWAQQEDWVAPAERADAYRQAATATLVLDLERGRRLLRDAAEWFAREAPTYAMFLEAIGRPEALREISLRAGAEVRDAFTSDRGTRPMPTADGSAARLLHLLLLTGSSTEMATEFRPAIGRAAESPAANSPIPFGTAGAPLGDWWHLAISLCAPKAELERDELIDRLERLARPHGEQLRIARMDSFHWARQTGRVDLVDLDLACATMLVNRRLAAETEKPISSRDFSPGLTKLAEISLVVGIGLAAEQADPPPMPAGSGA